MEDGLRERLDAWRRAGIVDAATADAITRFELGGAPGEVAPAAQTLLPPGERISPAEGLTYLGVAVVLAGVLYAVFSSLDSRASGLAVLVLACVAAAAGLRLRGDGSATARRSAGAALAAAAGLAALATGQLLIAADAFIQSRTAIIYPGSGSGSASVTIVYTQRNEAALAAIAAGVAVLLGLAALTLAAVPFTAVLVSAAAYVAAMTSASAIAGTPGLRSGVATLVAAAGLVALGATDLGRAAAAPLRFAAAAVPPPTLLVLGTLDGAPTWPLILVATVVALGAMRMAVRLSSNSLALAAGVGVFGVSLDVAFRTLGGNGGAPVVLVVTGLLLLLSATLTQQAMKTRRNGAGPGAM